LRELALAEDEEVALKGEEGPSFSSLRDSSFLKSP
jgi:hypothetical protein